MITMNNWSEKVNFIWSIAELLRGLPDLDVGHADANTITGVLEPALRQERVAEERVLAVGLREEAPRGESMVGNVDGQRSEGLMPDTDDVIDFVVELDGQALAIGVQVRLEDDTGVAEHQDRSEGPEIDVTALGRGDDLDDAQDGREGVSSQVHGGLQGR